MLIRFSFADRNTFGSSFTRFSPNDCVQAGIIKNDTEAARALTKSGWTTAQKMAAATWEERTGVLNHAGYDEKTSRMLADTSNLLLKCYNGDLRKLREAAECDPTRERELLMECKGIGGVGADIFLREVQTAWTELQPFADAVR